MYRLLSVFIFLFIFQIPVLAAEDSNENPGFTAQFFCRNTVVRKLFSQSCDTAVFDVQTEEEADQKGSLQLRFFNVPPTSTPTPSNTPTPVPQQDNAPQTFPSNTVSESGTQQVDWVYNDQGVCWSAWAGPSCTLLPHEGGLVNGPIDITGDGVADVTCSQGTGTNKSTTITNISGASIPLRCERYTCASCMSGNGTHAQCDGQIDPSSERVAQEFSLAPGASEVCSWGGIGDASQNPEVPNQPENPEQPKPPIPPDPPQKPTPTLPPGQQPPIVTKCRVGTGYCSVENLMKYFGTYEKAYKASVICQAESSSNPLAANKACATGGTVDYSIGLYQINLLAHCAGAATYTWNPPSCRIVNQTKLNECETDYKNPDINIKKAVALSKNGTDWYPTWGAAGPQYCNIP